ncbi:hypothetical protein BGW37DRAFT_529920 [Umbelopsis sp. PMI_123]|nr:hypothetical protein BGW37DRAFT_529920 [Umbelopsis sp. PMI_123]
MPDPTTAQTEIIMSMFINQRVAPSVSLDTASVTTSSPGSILSIDKLAFTDWIMGSDESLEDCCSIRRVHNRQSMAYTGQGIWPWCDIYKGNNIGNEKLALMDPPCNAEVGTRHALPEEVAWSLGFRYKKSLIGIRVFGKEGELERIPVGPFGKELNRFDNFITILGLFLHPPPIMYMGSIRQFDIKKALCSTSIEVPIPQLLHHSPDLQGIVQEYCSLGVHLWLLSEKRRVHQDSVSTIDVRGQS